ncbi:MAG: glycosyl transferase group 1 [Gemmatimonadetes bacterium]|nr:glycosyl transferase group 1 [Gemmatimonadota bacterium]
MRVLMIANYLPYPQITGGRIRIYNLLRRVASRHDVSLAALLEAPEDADGVSHLRQFCVNVETASMPQRTRLAKAPGMLRYALQGKPPELMLLHSDELVGKIRQLCSVTDFDVVQIESVMGLYLATLPRTGSWKSIEMFQNFTSQQFGRISEVEHRWDKRLRARVNGTAMGRWEPRYAGKFDRCTTVSEADRGLLLRANPFLHVDVIPNGVDTERYQPLPPRAEAAPPRLMFIGSMGYPPCIDAVRYFCRDILPRVRRAIPAVELQIVGGDPHPEVVALGGDGVHVTGRVDDVVSYYQESTVCIVPLRAGGGTRLKILEAMALGRPVVSTTIGCEGLDVVDGDHLLVADTPEQFADKIVRLVQDPALCQHLCANGRQLVEAHYGWKSIGDRLMTVYHEMVWDAN